MHGARQISSRLLQRAAESDEPLLIVGESGAGKSRLARIIHERSGRRGELVVVNAALLAETAHSELFGHEKGSFTGAVARRVGAWERARAGTLLLDEAGDLSPALQATILLAISERRALRLGGSTPVELSARLLMATHSPHLLREDLRARAALEIPLMPLRERPAAEVAAIARALLRGIDPALSLSDEAAAWCARQRWTPGNARALRSALLRASWTLADGQTTIGLRDIGGAPEREREALTAAVLEQIIVRGESRWSMLLRRRSWTCREYADIMMCSRRTANLDMARLHAEGVCEPSGSRQRRLWSWSVEVA